MSINSIGFLRLQSQALLQNLNFQPHEDKNTLFASPLFSRSVFSIFPFLMGTAASSVSRPVRRLPQQQQQSAQRNAHRVSNSSYEPIGEPVFSTSTIEADRVCHIFSFLNSSSFQGSNGFVDHPFLFMEHTEKEARLRPVMVGITMDGRYSTITANNFVGEPGTELYFL